MNQHIIYLKALVTKQPKLTNTDEFKIKVKALAQDIYYDIKPKPLELEGTQGRDFILANIGDFLEHAVEYSLTDKFNDFIIPTRK